jgi:hypothetical protein
MSTNNVRLRIRAGANEIEIEAPLVAIKEALDLIPDVARCLPSAEPSLAEKPIIYQSVEHSIPNLPSSQPLNRTDIPEIRVERDDSLTDIITKIFRDSWGRLPRKLSQVREVLGSYGIIYPKQSVAVALLRLAQSGRLRRFKGEDGEFVYTASVVLGAETTVTGKD